jgi:hypothetical protein
VAVLAHVQRYQVENSLQKTFPSAQKRTYQSMWDCVRSSLESGDRVQRWQCPLNVIQATKKEPWVHVLEPEGFDLSGNDLALIIELERAPAPGRPPFLPLAGIDHKLVQRPCQG